VWYPRGGEVNVWLIAPDGEQSKVVKPDSIENSLFTLVQGERLRIQSDSATAWEGAARIQIRLDPGKRSGIIRFGTWKVCLELAPGAPENEITLDAWIERTVPVKDAESRSRWADYNPETAITLTTPGTGRLTITVASQLNDGDPLAGIAPSSGSGPTRDGRFKPELTAPGEVVVSSNRHAGTPDDKGQARPARLCMAGTSMAAPHVTGVIARMLSRNAYLRAKDIRNILFETAIRHPEAKLRPDSKWPWDRRSGYGTVNATAAVKRVEELAGTAAPDG
jgi:subtilisin family serine protease